VGAGSCLTLSWLEQNIKYFKIYRWDPESKEKPYQCTYPVDLDECVDSCEETGGGRRKTDVLRVVAC
jgi:hypothetical protein